MRELTAGTRTYVAGHTGLLGSALHRELSQRAGIDVIIRSHEELDLLNKAAVDEFFADERPEVVFLAAGRAGNIRQCSVNPATYLYENTVIQSNVFHAALIYDSKSVVYYGSSCTYAKDAEQPMGEDCFLSGPLEETSKEYAAAKASGILACRAFNHQYKHGPSYIAMVPNTMYGPGDHFSIEASHVFGALITRMHRAMISGDREVTLWGSGKVRREFIFSEDVARASIFAVENEHRLENHHYNVGTGVDFTILQLATLVAERVGYGGKISWDTSRPDGPKRKLLDSTKFSQLGWHPETDIEEGLDRTYEWFLSNAAEETATTKANEKNG
jgi:GDP-L-fucose synthase